MFYSKPGTFYFIDRIKSWMRRQNERLWCMVPFWDSVGVAMINACKAEELRIICRPGEVHKYLKKGVQVRYDPELHSKIIVGDSAALDKTLHSAEEISTSEMIVELSSRGVDMRSAIEQRKAEREKKAKIVKFPISDTV